MIATIEGKSRSDEVHTFHKKINQLGGLKKNSNKSNPFCCSSSKKSKDKKKNNDFTLESGIVDVKNYNNNEITKLDQKNDMNYNYPQRGVSLIMQQQDNINNNDNYRKINIQNSIIMVDEPETSLHPTWQQQLAKLYQSIGSNNQVILATHSPHILASVKPENIFLLSVKDSKIEATHLKDTDLKTKGVETNRILKEIMGVTKLMDEETSADMIALNQFIEADNFDKPEAIEVYNRLLTNLGKEDSYMVSVDFEIVMRNKMREKKLKAVV
jgi:predicted ATPase